MISLSPYTIDRELLSLLERQQKPPTTRYRPFNRLRPPHSTVSNGSESPCMPCHLCVCAHYYVYRPLSLSSCRDCRPEGSETIREHTPIPPPSAFVPPLFSDPAIPVYPVASGSHSSLSIHMTIRSSSSSSLVASESLTPQRSCCARE
jgi:hypothetical protein